MMVFMRNPSITEVLSLAAIDTPSKKSLDENFQPMAKRKGLPRFRCWAITVLTLGILAPNRRLDSVTKSIFKAASQSLLRKELSQEQVTQLKQSLANLKAILKANDGRGGRRLKQLIKQCANQAFVPSPSSPAPSPTASHCHCILEQEVARALPLDRPLGIPSSGSWRSGLGSQEQPQGLSEFEQDPAVETYKQRHLLTIRTIGQLSPKERKMLEVVKAYLEAVHGQQATLQEETLTMSQLKQRHIESSISAHQLSQQEQQDLRNQFDAVYNNPSRPFERHGSLPQYNFNFLVSMINNVWKNADASTSTLCFTKNDLYADGMNFIYGVGLPREAVGLFSIARLGDPEGSQSEFQECLIRLMKLATHEFGHMRGLPHCTNYACNMQGSNGHHEASPLIFCAQDMAKIALLNGWTLKEGYQRQLSFFENFSQRFGFTIDFSQEITQLKNRIRVL